MRRASLGSRVLLVLLAALTTVLAGGCFKLLPKLRGKGKADDAGGKIVTISNGEEVDVASRIERTGKTVVEFTADW